MTEFEMKLLADACQAAANIDLHLQGRRVLEEFTTDITRRRAVERELEIIG